MAENIIMNILHVEDAEDSTKKYILEIADKKAREDINRLLNSGAALVEPAVNDIPKVFFEGDISGMSKDDPKDLTFIYISNTAWIYGIAEVKWQGASSINYPKKNFTIKLYTDSTKTEKLKIDMKGWGEQSKFCLKANWIDLSHARNIVSARLWGDVVRSRSNFEELPELLKTSPNVGAIDGFPIKVYINGIYQGRYTWNIPKDAWTTNMDDKLDTHCILQGENYVSGCFRATTNISGGGMEGDGWSDELHDMVPPSIVTRWNEVIDFVMHSTDIEFINSLSEYFDVPSLIDYLIFGIVDCGQDAFAKNQIYFTYDGIKWIASMYDMDTTWGLYWDGSKFVEPTYPRTEFYDYTLGEGNLLYIRLMSLFTDEVKNRYWDLRNGVLNQSRIINRFERFTDLCSNDLVKEDFAATTANGDFVDIPQKETNNIQQIRNYLVSRLTYCDSYFANLSSDILDLRTLSKDAFTNGYDLDMSNGEVIEGSTNRDTTRNFVRVDGGSVIYISVNGLDHPSLPYGSIVISEYDNHGAFIKSTESPQPGMTDFSANFTLQEATAYIRIRINFLSTAFVLYAGTIG